MKKFRLNNAVIALLMVAITFVSCSKDENSETKVTAADLSGSITGVKTLDAGVTYTITGPVIVEDGGELNIPAGTTIKAKKGFSSYLLVLQGGKINVNGTADQPVVMTADDETGATSGYWGGLIINGKAPLPVNADGTASTGSTEINSAYKYGGTVPTDNSGSIKYLVIKYAGARSSADVEHNGLTLNAVGNGTVIENIYVYKSADDGVEFFGGTVNVTNLLVVSPDDDMFDFTQGYTGELKNAYGIWENGYTSTEADPRGIEADGNFDGLTPTQTGQSNFKVTNVTFDLRLAPGTTVATQMMDVMKIRRGAKITVANALVKGTGTAVDLVDFTDSKGDGIYSSAISLTNLLTTTPTKQINVTGTTTAPNVAINPSTPNTGCATNLFAWTKYGF